MPNNKTQKIAYSIRKVGEKTYWNRVGFGSVNKDGSINVRLFSYPVGGVINIRDPKDKKEIKEEVE